MTKQEKQFDLQGYLPEYTTISVRLTSDERKVVERMCKTSKRSVSDMIRYSLSDTATKWCMLWPETG